MPAETALPTGRSPAAMGRIFFSGCARSPSRSAMSLNRYTALAMRVKAAAAMALRSTACAEEKLDDEISGTNTSPFLIHCRGRQEIASDCARFTPSPAACRESERPKHPLRHSAPPGAESSGLRTPVADRGARAPTPSTSTDETGKRKTKAAAG